MEISNRKKIATQLVQEDRYVEALSHYAQLLKEDPHDKESIEQFLFLYGRIIDGNYDFEPETADEFLMRGTARFYRGEFHDSIGDYDKSLELDNQNDYAFKCRAYSLKTIGKPEQAIQDLHAAIEINPVGEYFDDLSEIYAEAGAIETALEYHKKAVEASPKNARLWYNYGVDLMEVGEQKEAIKMFDTAIKLWPKYDDAIVNRQYIMDNYGDRLK